MKANSSFPHPVLGVNQGVFPNLNEDALKVISITEEDNSYCYRFELKQGNEQINQYIQEGNAKFICEVDCEKTLYKRVFESSTENLKIKINKQDVVGCLEIKINKQDVVGRLEFYFYIVTTSGMSKYTNVGFNADYKDENGKFPSFYLETGSVLVVFPSFQDNVDFRFNNKPELNAFIQVVKGMPDAKNVMIDLSNDIINIELPLDMYNDFLLYNRDEYKGFFYNSLIFNTLVKAILNISENEGSNWADSINAIIENSPKKYEGLSLDNPADAVDIATIMLSHPDYGSPYDLLFSCIKKIED